MKGVLRRPLKGWPRRPPGDHARALPLGHRPVNPAEHRALAILLVAAGVGHLAAPRVYAGIVPRWLPGTRRSWVLASGVVQIAVGAAVAEPRTRRMGGLAAAALFVGVFPANLHMAWLWRRRPWPYRIAVLARLPLQIPLVAWGLRVANSAATATATAR